MTDIQYSFKKKMMAWILSICLVVTLIPEFAFAVAGDNSENSKSPDEVTMNDIVEKTEDITTYDLGGGDKMSVFHGGQVRFEDDKGKLVDYDPSLETIKTGETSLQDEPLQGYSYTNKAGDKKHYLPVRMSENTPVRMEYQDYAIEFSLTNESINKLSVNNEVVKKEDATIQTAYDDNAELPVNAVYGDEEDQSQVTYTSTEDSVKETLILNEKPETNVFQYKLNLTGMFARKNVTDGGITYYDNETEEIAGFIAAPWMNDATGEAYSEDITYELEEAAGKDGEYLLKMTIDEDYLNDPSRQYPVTIDPTNTWQGSSEVKDVYVISGSTYGGTNFYESGTKKMPSGKNSTGTHRTYIKFIDLKTVTSGKSISSAKFTAYQSPDCVGSQKIGIYRITESWSLSSLTYNNRPTCTTCYDTITTSSTDYAAKTWDVKTFVKNVASGSITNYGLQLYNKTSSPSFGCFVGSRASSYKPKLVVVYYSKPTVPTSLSLSRSSGSDVSYFTEGETIYANWAGISSSILSEVQYKITAYDSNTTSPTAVGSSGVDLTAYRSIGKAAASATYKSVGYTSSLPEGKYRLYLRGKDSNGYVGTAKSVIFYVDKAAPTLTDVTVTPSTSESSYSEDDTPTVSWNANDTHFSKVTISVDGSSEVNATTTPGTGSYTIPAEATLNSGAHTIKVTAYDKANKTSSISLNYYVDKDAPTGTISVTEQGTGANIEVLKDTVNICCNIDDKGSGIKSADLRLYKLIKTTDNNGNVAITESEEPVKTIFDNATLSTNRDVSTNEDTDKLDNGDYRLKLYIADNAGHETTVKKDVRIENPIAASEINIAPVKEGPVTVSWKFNETVDLKSIQYRLSEESGWKTVENSTGLEGHFQIGIQDEGVYEIEFRGVDIFDVNGEVIKKTCIVDKTTPVTKITSFYQGILKGNVSDENLEKWMVMCKVQGADDTTYDILFEGTAVCSNEKLGFIDLSEMDADKDYTLKLQAVDKAGNVSEDTCDIYVPSEGNIAKEIPAAFAVKRPFWSEYGTTEFSIKSETEFLELKIPDDYTLANQNTRWYIDNQKVCTDSTYHDNFAVQAETAKYEAGRKYRIFVINKDDDGKRTYSSVVTRNGVISAVDYNGATVESGSVEKTVNLSEDVVSFRLKASDKSLDGKNLSYRIKIGDEGWFDIETGRTYYIADLSDTMAYTDTFALKVTAEGATDTIEIGDTTLNFDIVAEEYFKISEMDNYIPESVAVKDKLNYKTYLYWDNVLPENDETITYEVYRGTDNNFIPSATTLAASNIRAGYFSEINVNYGGTFYYKIRAVKKDKNGNVVDTSNFSKCVGSTVIDGNEYTKRMGLKDYWKYAQVETPNGTAAIEKSAGNLVYQQKDAEIPNEQLLVEMTRSYNSTSSAKSAFGLGWTHDFDMELLSICEGDTVDFKNVVLKDGSGTIYHFIKQTDGTYVSSLGKYIIMEKEEKSEQLKLPERTIGIATSDKKKNVTVNSSYTLKTKDNMEYRFNSGGQMVYQGEPNGNFLLFEYDDRIGLLKKVSTSKNISIEFKYSSADYNADELLVKQVKLPDGTVLDYNYKDAKNSANQLLVEVIETPAVTDAYNDYNAISYKYEYDNNDNLVSIIDAKGNEYKVSYSSDGKEAVAITYPDSDEEIQVKYNGDDSTTTQKLVKGIVVSEEKDFFNYYGNCVRSIDAEGYETNYTYQNNLLSITTSEVDGRYLDDNGYVRHPEVKEVKTETVNYDADDNPTLEIEEDGTKTDYSYCGGNNEITDDLIQSEKEIDGEGNLVMNETYDYDETTGNIKESFDSVSGTLIRTEYFDTDDATIGAVKGEVKSEKEYAVLEDGTEKLQSTTTYKYEYDEQGNKTETITQTIDGDTITTITKTDVLGREIYSSDRGKIDEHIYDGFGRLVKTSSRETGDDGNTISSTITSKYDENGCLILEVDEEGLETHYEYDEMNRLVKQWQEKDGAVLNIEKTEYGYENITIYTGAGQKEISNAFVTTVKTIDPGSGLIKTVTAVEKTYQNAIGQTVRECKNGIITDVTYDGQDNIVTRFEIGQYAPESEGMLTVFLYDSNGNQTAQIQNPVYDQQEETFKVDPTESIVEKMAYDSNGNVVSETDGKGQITNYKYDAEGNLTEIKLPNENVTSYEYDVEQDDGTTATIMTDAKGNKYITKTDDSDRTVEISDIGDGEGASITTKYDYDEKDNVIKETDGEGNYKSFTYDGRDRLKQTSYYTKEDVETMRTIYTYDLTDNITSMADYKVDNEIATLYRYTKYKYDKQKRLVGFAECAGSTALNADGSEDSEEIQENLITFIYDSNDNLTEITYPDKLNDITGMVFQYNSDTQWLEKIYAKNKSGSTKLLREYTYTSDNKVASMKDYRSFMGSGNSFTLHEYEYDKFDRPITIKYYDSSDLDNPKEVYTYEFDNNNNITQETLFNDYPSDGDKVDETREHTFDVLDQLVKTDITNRADNTTDVIEYVYDKAGNRTKEANNESIKEYQYNDLNQLVSSIEKANTDGTVTSDVTYQYDKNGNQITESDSVTGEVKAMTYNEDNRLKTFTKSKNGSITFTQTNQYNGEGKRIKKTETDSTDTNTISYFYQNDAVLYTSDENSSVTAFNVMGAEDNVISTVRTDGGDDTYYFYNKDIRESTTNLIDTAGESVVSYEYSDYGETTINGNIDFYNEICYTGGIYDKNTELYYLNARYYDPDDAVFLTQDTYRGEANDPSSHNLYAYCANNPVTYTDPSGHFPVAAVIGAAWGAYDGYQYAKKKKLTGIKKVGAIAGGAVLGVVNPFKKVGKAYQASKRVTRIASKPKVSKSVVKSIKKAVKPSRIKRQIKRYKIKTVHAAKRAQCKITRKGCFVAGTMIAVKDGFLPIEKIKAGDRVWSEDTKTGNKELKEVKKIFVREKDSIIRLSINGEVIETTDEHPFFVKDIGWIPAGELGCGDLVKLKSDDYVPIETYEVVALDELIKVYNFEVADNHTYYVTESNVLVHNDYKNKGRSGKQSRLKELANDDKISRSLRGEIKRDINQIKREKRKNIRVPQGYNLAHRRGKEAAKGYSYKESDLQDINAHKRQHRLERVKKKKNKR